MSNESHRCDGISSEEPDVQHCRIRSVSHTIKLQIQHHSHQKQYKPRCRRQLGSPGLPLASLLRPRLLRHRNDAHLHAALRPRPTGHHLPRLPSPGRRHDCGRDRDEQDGAGGAPVLRPDAGPEMGYQHGHMRKRGWVLPLQLLGGKGC